MSFPEIKRTMVFRFEGPYKFNRPHFFAREDSLKEERLSRAKWARELADELICIRLSNNEKDNAKVLVNIFTVRDELLRVAEVDEK